MRARGALDGGKAIEGQTQAVEQLRLDAVGLGVILARQRALHRPKKGNAELLARKRLIQGMARLYRDVWQKEPGVSRDDDGKPRGPFVRLMLQVFQCAYRPLGKGCDFNDRGIRGYCLGADRGKSKGPCTVGMNSLQQSLFANVRRRFR